MATLAGRAREERDREIQTVVLGQCKPTGPFSGDHLRRSSWQRRVGQSGAVGLSEWLQLLSPGSQLKLELKRNKWAHLAVGERIRRRHCIVVEATLSGLLAVPIWGPSTRYHNLPIRGEIHLYSLKQNGAPPIQPSQPTIQTSSPAPRARVGTGTGNGGGGKLIVNIEIKIKMMDRLTWLWANLAH